MPLVMFCVSILLMMILIKELRLSLAIASLFCVLIFTISIKMNDNLRIHYTSFYQNSSGMMANIKKYVSKKYPELEKRKGEGFTNKYIESKKLQSKYEMLNFGSGHTVIYLTAIDVWMDNPIIGNGIKSFRIKCLTNFICQTEFVRVILIIIIWNS